MMLGRRPRPIRGGRSDDERSLAGSDWPSHEIMSLLLRKCRKELTDPSPRPSPLRKGRGRRRERPIFVLFGERSSRGLTSAPTIIRLRQPVLSSFPVFDGVLEVGEGFCQILGECCEHLITPFEGIEFGQVPLRVANGAQATRLGASVGIHYADVICFAEEPNSKELKFGIELGDLLGALALGPASQLNERRFGDEALVGPGVQLGKGGDPIRLMLERGQLAQILLLLLPVVQKFAKGRLTAVALLFDFLDEGIIAVVKLLLGRHQSYAFLGNGGRDLLERWRALVLVADLAGVDVITLVKEGLGAGEFLTIPKSLGVVLQTSCLFAIGILLQGLAGLRDGGLVLLGRRGLLGGCHRRLVPPLRA